MVKSVYGDSGGLGERLTGTSFSRWRGIVKAANQLVEKGINLFDKCVCRVGDGSSVLFWHDVWEGDVAFKVRFHRVFRLDLDGCCKVSDRSNQEVWGTVLRRQPRGGEEMVQFLELRQVMRTVSLSNIPDTWVWALESDQCFTVASARRAIDAVTLDCDLMATRWNRFVPAKVNVFAWKLRFNKLPTRVNLDSRGMDIGSVLCPICRNDVETANHLFFSCSLAFDLWALVARWWDVDVPVLSSMADWVEWIDGVRLRKSTKDGLEVVCLTIMWWMWNFRNNVIFGHVRMRRSALWDDIQSHSFLWLSARCRKFSKNWVNWLSYPKQSL